MACATAAAAPVWVVDPGSPGPDAPPQGRSLFDFLTIQDGRQTVPYPFESLLERLNATLDASDAYLGQPLKKVLIPLGRSLQREAAAPDFFRSPRLVVAVDAEPATSAQDAGMLLRDRLFIAYLEAADVLEIISYNETAARFEFQVVRDYRRGAQPQVRYARRVVCIACHQNAAPIFARPLWDETNANADVARQLAGVASNFHGIPARRGVDIAYAIDNATDRANEFSLTQKLWQDGCGQDERAARCRRALLIRALQSALAGARGLERASAGDAAALREVMSGAWRRNWPDGLLIPDADLANRKPLDGFESLGRQRQGRALPGRANVAAPFEPLAARPAATTWLPDPSGLVARAAGGLRQFIAHDDIRRIDQRLAQIAADGSSFDVACDTRVQDRADRTRIKIACESPRLALRGLIYRADADRSLDGRLRSVQVDGEDLGALVVSGHEAANGNLEMILDRPESPLLPRLVNGDALGGLTLRWQGPGQDKAVLRVRIRHDFQSLRDAVDRAAQQDPRLFSGAPFRRAELMAAVFNALGIGQRSWCCSRAPAAPPVFTVASDPPPEDPLLRPFFQVCGACHRSSEPFPPNFLAGTAQQARNTVSHCAERIQYRLAMWDLDAEQRTKTPMPPQHAGQMDDVRLQQWRNGLLPELRSALQTVSEGAAEALPSHQQIVARPYHELRRCLPAG